MKRLIALFLFVLLVTSAAQAQTIMLKWRDVDTEVSARTAGFLYPLPIQESPFNSFLTVATPSFTVQATAASMIGTLPTGTRVVSVGAVGGVINFGGSSIASGTGYPFTIASGSFREFTVATTTPGIYIIGQSGDVTARILAR